MGLTTRRLKDMKGITKRKPLLDKVVDFINTPRKSKGFNCEICQGNIHAGTYIEGIFYCVRCFDEHKLGSKRNV